MISDIIYVTCLLNFFSFVFILHEIGIGTVLSENLSLIGNYSFSTYAKFFEKHFTATNLHAYVCALGVWGGGAGRWGCKKC